MKRLIFVFSVLATISTCSLLSAQDIGKVPPNGNADNIMLSDVPQTEGMWYYLHGLKRTDDPKMLVRRAAEKKGEQRRLRLAASKWFGHYQGRPSTSTTPTTGVYGSVWIGNGVDPYQWVGAGYVPTIVHLNAATESTVTVRR
ncbi:MAG: hypothetical protein FJ276_11815 [Planctomycetes bacterium]|nr:hypothetical protein [Planctomycetota bacterium]